MTSESAQIDFHPVILGTDIGAYAMARQFHEGWGKVSTVVTRRELGPIRHSQILDVVLTPKVSPDLPELVQGLMDVAPRLEAEYPGQKLLLMANIDSYIWEIMEHEELLRQHYVFAFPSLETMDKTNDKAIFPQLAEKFGMQVPPTLTIDFSDDVDELRHAVDGFDHPYPLIVKPAMGYGYELLSWPGKAKVYTVHDPSDMDELLVSLKKHLEPYPEARRFVVQPRVDGNDSYNLSITAYVDSSGRVTMLGSAHVLLEDRSPTALGNPVAMITEPYPQLYRQSKQFLENVGWFGFANFDIKVDKHSGEAYFFEVNPRIGRNSYYNTAAGLNPFTFLINDVVYGKKVRPQVLSKRIFYSLLPKHLVFRYVDKPMRAKINHLYRQNRYADPMINPAEREFSLRALRRELYTRLSRQKHWLKYHRNYPRQEFMADGGETFSTKDLL